MGTSLFEYINPRYLEGIVDEPKQPLQPIAGYAREPLLPLEDACEPLITIVPCLQAHLWIAKQNSNDPGDGLTQDESAAIRLYTMEWDTSGTEPRGSLYSHLNQTLKEIDRTKLRPWFRYLKLFLTALAKIPPAPRQTVWRGVRSNVATDYPPGAESTWWSFSSCTTSLSILESNLYLGNTGTRTLFSVEVFNGRMIRAHSHFVTEQEILLLPGTFFEVKSRLNPAPDLYIVHLQQKIPSFDLLEPPFEGAELFPPIEQYRYKSGLLDVNYNNHKRPWYKLRKFYFGATIVAIIIILIILLAAILGSRNKNKQSPASQINDLDGNYNISSYSPASIGTAFYPFDGNVLDLYSQRDGTINGDSLSYIDGYVGYGQAIAFNQTNLTSISIANPFNLTNTAFTFELFVYLYTSGMNAPLIQFSSSMQLYIVNGNLQMFFTAASIIYTLKPLTINEWHHIAVVYDIKQAAANIYNDGVLAGSVSYASSATSLNGNVTTIIGSGYQGAIDQLAILMEAKSAQQILWDATVAAFYPLEGQINGIIYDYGPNGLNTTAAGMQSVRGQVHNAVNFNVSGSYVQAPGFTVLNIPQHAFTIAFWIRPSTNPGVFLTIANSVSCLLVLGLRTSDNYIVAYLPNSTNTNTGTSFIGSEILINRWTHIAFTWSSTNQAQFYKDTVWEGRNSNATKLNNGNGNPMTITLGMYRDNTVCTGGDGLDSTKQFTGSLDELYVFSRELKQNEIETLKATTN